jgi:putative flippase GtrA
MTDESTTPGGLRHYWLVRHRRNWELLFKFIMVGGAGFFVNLIVYKGVQVLWGASFDTTLVDLPGGFHIRVYHVCSTIAFLVANANNYFLNRVWTFRSGGTTHWLREYIPFLLLGAVAQGLVLIILTVLQHHDSPLRIDSAVIAQAIAIIVVTPLSFIGNKMWTFRRVRGRDRTPPA